MNNINNILINVIKIYYIINKRIFERLTVPSSLRRRHLKISIIIYFRLLKDILTYSLIKDLITLFGLLIALFLFPPLFPLNF